LNEAYHRQLAFTNPSVRRVIARVGVFQLTILVLPINFKRQVVIHLKNAILFCPTGSSREELPFANIILLMRKLWCDMKKVKVADVCLLLSKETVELIVQKELNAYWSVEDPDLKGD
jgi:hypothetical protein